MSANTTLKSYHSKSKNIKKYHSKKLLISIKTQTNTFSSVKGYSISLEMYISLVSQPETAQCCSIIDSYCNWWHADRSKMAGCFWSGRIWHLRIYGVNDSVGSEFMTQEKINFSLIHYIHSR